MKLIKSTGSHKNALDSSITFKLLNIKPEKRGTLASIQFIATAKTQ